MLPIDKTNKVVMLCAAGIEAEMQGDFTTAIQQYAKAWEAGTNDFEACIAAHYMARLQNCAEDMLHWNKLALQHADALPAEYVAAFYPSLYLNVGNSYEESGDKESAMKYYKAGVARLGVLPDDRLGRVTREALMRHIDVLKQTGF